VLEGHSTAAGSLCSEPPDVSKLGVTDNQCTCDRARPAASRWTALLALALPWLSSVAYGTFNGRLWLWGTLDTVAAIVAIYAGYDILRGGTFGRVIGVIVAGVSALRWFFYLPAAPGIGMVMIAVDTIIIYALVAHGDFFASARRGSEYPA
jgi:hypothetical protein